MTDEWTDYGFTMGAAEVTRLASLPACVFSDCRVEADRWCCGWSLPQPERRAEMSGSAGTLRSGECAFADELRSGDARTGRCRADQREFSVGVAGWDDVGARVFRLGSAESLHAPTIAYTERLASVLTDLDFGVYDKAMTTTLAQQPIPTRGSGPVQCTDERCHGHRARCNFGRPHQWATWFTNGQLMRTEDTYHCHGCGGVCIGDES